MLKIFEKLREIFKKRSRLLVIFLVIFFSVLSYGKALDFNFWRDDWSGLWLIKYSPKDYRIWGFQGRHPGDGLLFLPYYLVGMNKFLWQLIGLILKIIASLSLGLAAYSLTKKRIAFIITSLLYASYFGGLESYTWVSARLSALFIILISLFTFFYIRSFDEKSKKNLLFSYLFLIVSFIIEPAKSIFIPLVVIAWEFSQRFIDKSIFRINFLIRLTLTFLISYLGLGFTKFGGSFVDSNNSSSYLKYISENPSELNNYFNSLGNIIISYFRNVRDYGALLGSAENLLLFVGILFLCLVIVTGVILTILGKKSAPIITMLGLWIPLFYFPGWLAGTNLIVGASHRYIAVSSAGFIILISYLLVNIPKRFKYYFLIIIICLNLLRSYQTIKNDYQIRGIKTTQYLLNSQSSDIKPGEVGGIFIVTGTHYLRGYVFDWSKGGTIPYALAKGIKDEESVPSGGISYELAGQLVCQSNIKRPSIYRWVEQNEPVPMNKVYGWMVNDFGNLENNTDDTRLMIAKNSDCYQQKVALNLTDDLLLNSVIQLNDLYNPNQRLISLNWDTYGKTINQLFIYLSILDEDKNITAYKLFDLKIQKGSFETTYVFNKLLGEPSEIDLKIKSCSDESCFWIAKDVKIILTNPKEEN